MWPFRRKAKPAPRSMREPMDTWRVGDLAECIEDSGWRVGGGPRKGERNFVSDVFVGENYHGQVGLALYLVGVRRSDDYGFGAGCFRKIVDVGVEEPTRTTAKRKEPAS